jgi:hypothetical protein
VHVIVLYCHRNHYCGSLALSLSLSPPRCTCDSWRVPVGLQRTRSGRVASEGSPVADELPLTDMAAVPSSHSPTPLVPALQLQPAPARSSAVDRKAVRRVASQRVIKSPVKSAVDVPPSPDALTLPLSLEQPSLSRTGSRRQLLAGAGGAAAGAGGADGAAASRPRWLMHTPSSPQIAPAAEPQLSKRTSILTPDLLREASDLSMVGLIGQATPVNNRKRF